MIGNGEAGWLELLNTVRESEGKGREWTRSGPGWVLRKLVWSPDRELQGTLVAAVAEREDGMWVFEVRWHGGLVEGHGVYGTLGRAKSDCEDLMANAAAEYGWTAEKL